MPLGYIPALAGLELPDMRFWREADDGVEVTLTRTLSPDLAQGK